jgi:hypothetical protein
MGSAVPKVDEFQIGKAGSTTHAAVNGKDRRRHTRCPLGLPVGVHIAGRPAAITVELLDLSATGGRFRAPGGKVRVDETATVAFVLDDQRRCQAEGQVVRADPSGEFAIRLERANQAFASFIRQLAE